MEQRATTQEDKMSVFGSIVSAIFGSKHAAGVTAAGGSSSRPSVSARKKNDVHIRSACRRNRSRRACGRTGGKADLKSRCRSDSGEARR